MLRSINRCESFVTDQDNPLDVFVDTLGLQLAADVDLGNAIRIGQLFDPTGA